MVSRRTLQLDPIRVGGMTVVPTMIHREMSLGAGRARLFWTRTTPRSMLVRHPDGRQESVPIRPAGRGQVVLSITALIIVLMRRNTR